jgi:hypothetical protein
MRFFVWTYENQISHKFCMNLLSLVSLWCLLPTKIKCLNLCLSSSHSSIYDLEHPQRCSICNNPAKIFLTSKFGYFLFPTSPIELKLRLQIRERLLIANQQANHCDWSMRNREQQEQNLNCWAKPAHFDFSSSNISVQGHILSTAGDGLTSRAYISFVFVNCQLCCIRTLENWP